MLVLECPILLQQFLDVKLRIQAQINIFVADADRRFGKEFTVDKNDFSLASIVQTDLIEQVDVDNVGHEGKVGAGVVFLHAFILDNGKSDEGALCVAVDAGGSNGIIHIRQCNHLGEGINVFPDQVIGITRPVATLVVL